MILDTLSVYPPIYGEVNDSILCDVTRERSYINESIRNGKLCMEEEPSNTSSERPLFRTVGEGHLI